MAGGLRIEAVAELFLGAIGGHGQFARQADGLIDAAGFKAQLQDAALDAAMISKMTGRPVRVQYMRHDATAWDPKAPASIHRARAALDANGKVTASLGYNKKGLVESYLPKKLVNTTIYNQYGNKIIALILAFFAVFAFMFRKKQI
jgi:hypothetical protein